MLSLIRIFLVNPIWRNVDWFFYIQLNALKILRYCNP